MPSEPAFATYFDTFYQVTVLVVAEDPRSTANRVRLANKARTYLREHFEDTFRLFKCDRCHMLHYAEETKDGRCQDADCMGACKPTD